MSDYIDILRHWQKEVVLPIVFDHLDELLPSYHFHRRRGRGGREYWASPMKIDFSRPKVANKEKTVVYSDDMNLREQGDWNNRVSVIDAICQQERLSSIYDFNKYISARYNLEMPAKDRDAYNSINRTGGKTKVLEALQDYFVWNLKNNVSAKAEQTRRYLQQTRGFTEESIQKLGFGFVPNWDRVVKFITEHKGLKREELDNLCGEGENLLYGRSHVLSIPYVCAGVLKGFIFRAIDKDVTPRYMANPGLDRKSVFFNMPVKAECLIVVEGEMDALKCRSIGIDNVVSIGGSEISGERRLQIEDAFRRGMKSIILCFDLDAMDREESLPDYDSHYRHVIRSIHSIRDVDPYFEDIRIVIFPYKSDPDEYIRSNGKPAFIKLLSEAKPYWLYISDYHTRL